MSLHFTRRSFFRAVATALATVACVGLLAGCGEDSNKPTRDGDGKITNLNITVDVEQSTSNERTFTFDFDDDRENTVVITPDSFRFTVEHNGMVKYYTCAQLTFSNYETSDDDKNYDAFTKTNFAVYLEQGDDFKVDVTISDDVTIQSGDEVIIYFTPDSTYKEMYSGWIYTW